MKTRLLSMAGALVAAVLLSIPTLSRAGGTTILYSQTFSTSTMPPAGWSAGSTGIAASNPNTYSTGDFFYWSSGGANGSDGSAVFWEGGAYDYVSYGSNYVNGVNYNGPMSLTTPVVNTNFAVGDTQFVDFDLFYPEGGYMSSYAQMKTSFSVYSSASTTKLLGLTGGGGSQGDCTWYSGNYPSYGTDPSGYVGSPYWRHYHLALPSGVASQSIQFYLEQTGSATYAYWYTDNVAIDNVVITNVHYDLLSFLSSTTLTFSNQPLGTTSNPQYVKFKNMSGSKTYSLTNYTFGGSNPNQFVLTYSKSTLAPGATDSVGVAYAPTLVGSKTATLSFNTTSDNYAIATISLNGFGVAPQISLPPNLILFAKTHTRFRQTITQSFAVLAQGTVPLTIAPPPATFISGDYPNNYKILRYPKNPIPAGQTDTFTVSFTATVEGGTAGILNIASNASNGTQQVPMHGVGVLPRLAINNVYGAVNNQIAMPFDSVKVGTQKCGQVSFYNPGTDTLLLLQNFLSSKDFNFSITPLTGTDTILAPQQTKTMNVCFTPLRNGFRTATLRVATNIPLTFPINPPVDPNTFGPDTSGFSVNFTGTGVPYGNLSITGQSMDSVPTGTQGCMKDTIWNTGSATVQVTAAMLTGGDSSMFTFSGLTFPISLGANAFQAFSICGTPATAGLHSTLFTATGTQGDGSAIATPFPVSVFGQKSCDTIMATTPFPAMTCVCGNGDTATISVKNCGDIGTAYTASITGANANDYTIVGSAKSPVESGNGGTATYMIAYHPTARGASAASFVITGGPGGTWALNGVGGAPMIAGTAMAPVTDPGKTSTVVLTLHNTGECAWTPGAPSLPAGSTFTFSGASTETTTSIAAGGTGTMTFTFAPTTSGNVNDAVTFPSASCTSMPGAAVTLTGATAGVPEFTAQLGYSIEQNYPNPFSHETSVTMTLPKSDIVKLTIINQKGQVVRTVMNQRMAEGTFNITLNADDLASGTYYYQMSTSSVTLTRQMVIVK